MSKTRFLFELDFESVKSKVFVRLIRWGDWNHRICRTVVEEHLGALLQFKVDVADKWISAVGATATDDTAELSSLVLEESAEGDRTSL